MKPLEKLNQWLTVLTNLGVIAGLFVLVYEIQQNTQSQQNETDVAIYSMSASQVQMLFESSELLSAFLQTRSKQWDELSEKERLLMMGFWSNELDRAELQYRMYRRAGEGIDNIVFYEPDLRLAAFHAFWQENKFMYQPDFVHYFDDLIASANKRE